MDKAENAMVTITKERYDFHIAEIERLREELRVSRQSTTILIKSLDEEIERLHQQKTELIKALEFYANPYGEAECVPDFYSELDFGELAQDAIAKATGVK